MSIIITARGGSGGGSPQSVSVPNETDWASYTPTFQGLGTVTGIETEWRQVGDSYEIRGKLVTGTVTASTIQIGLPNSATSANSSKIPSITMAGILTRDASAASGTIFPILIQPSVTYVTVGGNFAGGAVTGMSTLTSQTGSALLNNGETESFFCTVPIAGLSANTNYTINSIGTPVAVSVPNVTDWVSYPLTIGGSGSAPTKGTTSIDSAMWRRVGDSVQIRYDYKQTAAGTGGTGIYLFPLPAGLAVDTAKITPDNTAQSAHVGFCEVQNSGNAGSYAGTVFAYDTGNVGLFLSATDSKSFASAGPGNFVNLSNTSVAISLEATLPISGWTANTVYNLLS